MALLPGQFIVGQFDVRLDVVDSPQEATLDNLGWHYFRNAVVSGLNGSGPDQLRLAVAALQNCPVTPPMTRGASHPTIPDARLAAFHPRSRSVNVAHIRIEYSELFGSTDTSNRIEVGATAQQVQTNIDVNGNFLFTNYKGKHYGATVSKLVPATTIKVTREEIGSPGDKAKNFVGTTNIAGWDLDPSAQPRCWMCMAIRGTSNNRGITYQVDYEFAFQPPKSLQNPYAGGWDEAVATIDPATGQPYTDYTNAFGVTGPDYFQIYNMVPFQFGFVA